MPGSLRTIDATSQRYDPREGIPLALINGRISESSFKGYRRLRWLFSRLLSCFDRLIVQNRIYAERLEALGAPPERVHVSGSIKYDRIETRRDNPDTRNLAARLGISRSTPVFVAGSTQEPEERLAMGIEEAQAQSDEKRRKWCHR